MILIMGLMNIFRIKQYEKKSNFIILFLSYGVSMEIISRMSGASPFIPYEIGKYLTFLLLIFGISINRNSYDFKGYLIVVFLVPGVFVGLIHELNFKYIIFNALGMINFGLGIVFFSGVILHRFKLDLFNLLRLISLPILMALIYAVIKTPNYDDVDFSLGANFDTSGGFGSNQVSTAFGLGFFLVFYLWYKGKEFSGFPVFFDISVFVFFLFQGLLTFSRGGIIGGILGLLMILAIDIFSKNSMLRIAKLIGLGLPFLLLTFAISNNLTEGNLLLRYQGETSGTLLGAKEKNLNTVTTGRFDIFLGDVDLFLDNPVFGVGVNQSRKIRKFHEGVVAHVEFSRLLAEHGLFGLCVFLFIISFIFQKWFYLTSTRGNILYILFIIGLYTTFHAATRTFISPLLMSLAYLSPKNLEI
jgi:hypothetical protein